MLSKKKINLVRSTFVVSCCTMVSRVLGFIRDILMADLFGTTLTKSAFDIAFVIPNLLRRVLGEGAFSAAFVPVYTEVIKNKGREAADRIAGGVLTLLGCILLVIVGAGVALISLVMLGPPLDERVSATIPMLRIMLPYAFFICMVAGCMAVLNSLGRFAVSAISPALLNVVWIGTLLFICPKFGETPSERIYGVAWGVLAAGALQLLVQVPELKRCGFKAHVSFDWRNEEIRKIIKLMGPAAIGMGVFQFNFTIDRLLAMYVASWAPAALTFSERLIYFPLGTFATALSTVLLPTFSRQVSKDSTKELLTTLAASLKSVSLIMIPASVGIFVLARPLVELAFERGVFTSTSTTLTTRALWFYSPGLLVFSLSKVFVPAFYALKDTTTPVKAGLLSVVINLVLNIIFILTWPADYKHAGLAFATVISSAVNSIQLGVLLTRRVGSPGWMSVIMTMLKALMCSVVMGIAVFILQKYTRAYIVEMGLRSIWALLVSLAVGVLCGAGIYLSLALLVCKDETLKIIKSLKVL